MAEITAAAVKELRDRSGAGMMDCKKALTEANGDIEAATDWLRAGTKGVAVEVNSETDFVAKNDQFQDFVRTVSTIALENGVADADALSNAAYPAGGTVAEKLVANIATIGENQTLRRVGQVEVSQGVVVPYVHNAAAPGLGKIGVLVALEGDASADVLEPLGKQIAMHIAAAFPLALSSADIDPALLERERAIAAEKAAESGKPAEIVAKMVDGAVAKYAKENALLSQLFVMDNKTPVADVVAKAAKEAGASITLKNYIRFQLGEGIEKETSDFAAEVAAAAGV
jgi:elongation factor Ts